MMMTVMMMVVVMMIRMMITVKTRINAMSVSYGKKVEEVGRGKTCRYDTQAISYYSSYSHNDASSAS